MENNRFYGVYGGVVVDNQDPEKALRIRVKVPALFQEQVLDYWAFPFGVASGSRAGMVLLPKVGQNVWVMFGGGDLEYPLWTYGAFRSAQQPEEVSDTVSVWRTENGNLIRLDEEAESISLEQPDGFRVELSPEGVFLGKNAVNLKSFLTELLDLLAQNAKTITALGPQPFTADTIVLLNDLKSKITNFLK